MLAICLGGVDEASMNIVTNWFQSRGEPRTEPVDHRKLKKRLRPLLVIFTILWFSISVILLVSNASTQLICAVTGFMLGIWMIPASLVIGATIHEWYWIARVFVGGADERYLPPIS